MAILPSLLLPPAHGVIGVGKRGWVIREQVPQLLHGHEVGASAAATLGVDYLQKQQQEASGSCCWEHEGVYEGVYKFAVMNNKPEDVNPPRSLLLRDESKGDRFYIGEHVFSCVAMPAPGSPALESEGAGAVAMLAMRHAWQQIKIGAWRACAGMRWRTCCSPSLDSCRWYTFSSMVPVVRNRYTNT